MYVEGGIEHVYCPTLVNSDHMQLKDRHPMVVTNELSLSSSRNGANGVPTPGKGSGRHCMVRQRKTGDMFIGWLVS